MRRRVGRERERERGRGKVWEWSRSGRREDEDANRAADPRGREGRVESGLPQQQQQTKKIRRGGSWYWGTLGRSPVRPSDLRVGGLPRHPKNVVQLLVPHGEPPFRTLSLSLSLSLSRRSRRAKFSLLLLLLAIRTIPEHKAAALVSVKAIMATMAPRPP